MRSQHYAKLVALALLAPASSAAPALAPAEQHAPLAPATIEPGDVVFIAVDSALWSQLAARWSAPARRFGHVGIAAEGEAGAIIIVHAGGSPVAGAAPVLIDSYEHFAAEADRVGIYRLRAPEAVRAAAGAAALGLQRSGATFDSKFSLASTHELYCTELVWRAIKAGAHLDPAPRPRVVANRAVITMNDLENSALLYEIGFTARE